MMSCTTLAAWSRLVLSLCCTKPGPSRGVVLSGHITTIAMSRSGQLGLHCTVELYCIGLSAHLAGTSVTRNHALDTCEPSYVPVAGRPFFIAVVHSPLGVVGYMAASEPISVGRRGPELRNTWQRQSSPLGEARPGAMGHVAVPEPTLAGR
jgi:hypothetical protein